MPPDPEAVLPEVHQWWDPGRKVQWQRGRQGSLVQQKIGFSLEHRLGESVKEKKITQMWTKYCDNIFV